MYVCMYVINDLAEFFKEIIDLVALLHKKNKSNNYH